MASPYARPDLLELGRRLLAEGPVRTLATAKRVRIQFGGVVVADTTEALYVWEKPFYPFYYVPAAAFRRGALRFDDDDDDDDGNDDDGNDGNGEKEGDDEEEEKEAKEEGEKKKPGCRVGRLVVGDRATDRVLAFGRPARRCPELAGRVRVEFAAADAWFEEDERIYVHPRDPYKRVDILPSARPLRVLVDGVEVASAPGGAHHLYETGLPVRYYLPATAVDPALLRESATTTACPYKGIANYYTLVLGAGTARERTLEDVVWYYRNPAHESARVAGLLCFYNEKVDIELDGKMLERPRTVFS